MTNNQNTTTATTAHPTAFVDAVEHPTRRQDARSLLAMMERIAGWPPKMWGPSIIGFGRYHYTYDSGREGDAMVTGFAPRKANMVLYVMPGYDDLDDRRAALGKHRIGKSCAGRRRPRRTRSTHLGRCGHDAREVRDLARIAALGLTPDVITPGV